MPISTSALSRPPASGRVSPTTPTYLDTLILAQNLLPKLGKYKLNLVADALQPAGFQPPPGLGRRRDLRLSPGRSFVHMLEERGIHDVQEINPLMAQPALPAAASTGRHARHIHSFCQEPDGPAQPLSSDLRFSNLEYFKRVPRMPKSRASALTGGAHHRLGLRGRGAVPGHCRPQERCGAGAYCVRSTIFLEIQPLCNNRFMLNQGHGPGRRRVAGSSTAPSSAWEKAGQARGCHR